MVPVDCLLKTALFDKDGVSVRVKGISILL